MRHLKRCWRIKKNGKGKNNNLKGVSSHIPFSIYSTSLYTGFFIYYNTLNLIKLMNIGNIITSYKNKLDLFEIQLLCAHAMGKTREFVIAHPEYVLSKSQISNLKSKLNRRFKGEPMAYILGNKEFYGLDFIVNKHTLVPRPETELLVEKVISNLKFRNRINTKFPIYIIDVGTGSGNIITSLAHSLFKNPNYQLPITNYQFFAIDISKEALIVAKKNARVHGVNKKIKFLHGDLLFPVLEKKYYSLYTDHCSLIITANLPYLSKEIYASTPRDVKNFEPKSALYSPSAGLSHYKKLFFQIKHSLIIVHCSLIIFLEISPEQKKLLPPIIKKIFPQTKIKFYKDLAGKWRICEIKIKVQNERHPSLP